MPVSASTVDRPIRCPSCRSDNIGAAFDGMTGAIRLIACRSCRAVKSFAATEAKPANPKP